MTTNPHKKRVKAYRDALRNPDDTDDELSATERKIVEELSDEEREVIIEFDSKLMADRWRANRCGWEYHESILRELIDFGTYVGKLSESLEDGPTGRDAVDDLTEWVHSRESFESGYTIASYLSTLRVFAKDMFEAPDYDHLPERFASIEPGQFVEEDPAPDPWNVVEYEHVRKMAEAATHPRDRALFLVQWSLGPRPQKEMHPLQRHQIEFQDGKAMITLKPESDGLSGSSKTDKGEHVVVVGAPALKYWVEEAHPVHDDPEAEMGPETYIWVQMDKNVHLKYKSFYMRFKIIGEKAGIEVDHSPQHFRRSSASILARQPYTTERDLRNRYNWSRNSDAPEHYIQVHSSATNVNVMRCRGIDIEDEDSVSTQDTAPRQCLHCKQLTTRGLESCIWCHADLDESPVETPSTSTPVDTEKSLPKMIIDGDISAAFLRKLQKLEAPIRRETDIWQDLDAYIEHAEAMETQDDESAMSGAGVGVIAGWVGDRAHQVTQTWLTAKQLALELHPAYDYPLDNAQTVGVGAAILIFSAVIGGIMAATGLAQGLAAGEPGLLVATALGLAIGSWQVARDMPSIDSAYAELRAESQ